MTTLTTLNPFGAVGGSPDAGNWQATTPYMLSASNQSAQFLTAPVLDSFTSPNSAANISFGIQSPSANLNYHLAHQQNIETVIFCRLFRFKYLFYFFSDCTPILIY